LGSHSFYNQRFVDSINVAGTVAWIPNIRHYLRSIDRSETGARERVFCNPASPWERNSPFSPVDRSQLLTGGFSLGYQEKDSNSSYPRP
jgi:hypothetical protein